MAGLKKALADAMRNTATKAPGSQKAPKKGIDTVRIARARSAKIISRCRLTRSTSGPAISPKRMVGIAFAIRPRATMDADRVRTNSMMARPAVFIVSPK